MNTNKIIFILPNIYEAVNGVSNKYINFINYLSITHTNIVLFTTFKNNDIYKDLVKRDNINIIKTKGLTIPFYIDIKIPIITDAKLKDEIKDGSEIIIFNGEFFWLYDIFKTLKKEYKNIKIYPTMHTDYLYYAKNVYSSYNFNLPSCLNHLNHYLEKKIFNGIIVTGEKTRDYYKDYTDNIFNANEVNLTIFNNFKKDSYISNFYNFIYCGRISKEKNIEEVLDCCSTLSKKYNYNLHLIGDGPFLENLKTIIDLQYKNIKSKIIFHGEMKPYQINVLYQNLENRIFLFSSMSETFGKTPIEAGATGIPIFIKKSDITEYIYINKKNAFIFNDKCDFLELFEYFIQLDNIDKEIFIMNSLENIKKYDQNIIFNEWKEFLISDKLNKDKNKLNLMDIFTFYGISKFINCSGTILGD